MSYLDWLRTGSDFHKVSRIANGFKIEAPDDSLQCRERFSEIVDEAIGNASFEGYQILPHRSSREDLSLIHI